MLENYRNGGSIGTLKGWERGPKRVWPTLERRALDQAWGFSLVGGIDYLETAGRYSGVVTRRGETGLWLKVLLFSRILRLRRNTHWHKDASFDSLLFRAGLGHLGKGWIVRGTSFRRLPCWAHGLLYPSWNRVVQSYSL